MEKLQKAISFAATECNPSASEVALIGENSGNLFWKCSRKSLRSKQDVHAVIYDPGDFRDIYHTQPENLNLLYQKMLMSMLGLMMVTKFN